MDSVEIIEDPQSSNACLCRMNPHDRLRIVLAEACQ
nr:MAG TPA: hypothetical protein [Caudoviricetes sp.]